MKKTTLMASVLLISGAAGAEAQYPIGQAPVYSPPVTGYPAPIAPNYSQPAQQQTPGWPPAVTGHNAPYMPGFSPPLPPMR